MVFTTPGGALVYQTLIEPGDEVVALVPIYQQHCSIPESLGATVKPLRLREANGFLPDLDELAGLVNSRTKVIALGNPNNPTGSLMDRSMLAAIAEIAESCGAYLLSDEVYRGTDQEGSGTTDSVADLYQRGISTGSMSKAFSLAGLRLGWITGPTELIHRVARHRDYNTISVGREPGTLRQSPLHRTGYRHSSRAGHRQWHPGQHSHHLFLRHADRYDWPLEHRDQPSKNVTAFALTDIVPDPRITYRYRLVATSVDGTWGEADASFTSPIK